MTTSSRPDDVDALLRDALQAQGAARAALMDALARAVKQRECAAEPGLEGVEAALPRLAPYLLDQENGNVDGCAISVFRRVRIGPQAVEALLALAQRQPSALVIEALGLIDRELWSDAIESALTTALSHPETVGAAAYALYCREDLIRQRATVEALAVVARHPSGLAADRALYALACLTQRAHAELALEHLSALLDAAPARQRALLADTLGWATARGLPLLRQTARDPDPLVRAAAARALARRAHETPEAAPLLEGLSRDADAQVRRAAALRVDRPSPQPPADAADASGARHATRDDPR